MLQHGCRKTLFFLIKNSIWIYSDVRLHIPREPFCTYKWNKLKYLKLKLINSCIGTCSGIYSETSMDHVVF